MTDQQFPLYRQEHGGPEGIGNLLKVTKLRKKQPQDMNIVCLTEHVWFSLLVLFVTDTPHCLPLGDRIVYVCVRVLSRSAVSDSFGPHGHSPPGSSVYGISQARTLEWFAISHSRRPSQHRDRTHISCVPCIGRQTLYHRATWEAQVIRVYWPIRVPTDQKKKKERNILMSFAATWMDLEISILNQINQTKKEILIW